MANACVVGGKRGVTGAQYAAPGISVSDHAREWGMFDSTDIAAFDAEVWDSLQAETA